MTDQKPTPWDNVTFRYGPAAITVERATIRHLMVRDRIAAMLPSGDGVDGFYRSFFARAVAQTVQAEGVDGFTLPSPSASPDEIRAAFEHFQALDGGLGNAWYGALQQVDRAPGAEDFWPMTRLSEADSKN